MAQPPARASRFEPAQPERAANEGEEALLVDRAAARPRGPCGAASSSSSGRRRGPSSSSSAGVRTGALARARRPPRSCRRLRRGGGSSAGRARKVPSGCAGTTRPTLVRERRLAVGGEAHHLVLVAEAGEAEVLGHRGVEERRASAGSRRGRGPRAGLPRPRAIMVETKSPKPSTERQAASSNGEQIERRGEVREVVLDRHEPRRAGARSVSPSFAASASIWRRFRTRDAARGKASRVSQREPGLAREVGARLTRHRESVDSRSRPARSHAPADRLLREAGPVLDPPEPLLLHRRDEPAVAHGRRRGVGVIGREPDDSHAERPSGEIGEAATVRNRSPLVTRRPAISKPPALSHSTAVVREC